MEAPDKICIRKDDTAPFGFTPHWIVTTKVKEQDIVYIRKDTLLELLNVIRRNLYNWDYHKEQQCWKTYDEVIDKLNSL